MHRFLVAAIGLAISISTSPTSAQTIYPIDRAEILTGARFDFKVEFSGLADPSKVSVSVNGEDYAKAFGKTANFIEREDGKDQSTLILRDVSLARPGTYKIHVSDGIQSREVNWSVYDTGPRKAKNVILFIGDGMSPAHRIAARLLAKGIAEGKALGKLAIDDMPHMALVATAGSLIRRASAIECECERLEAALSRGEEIDLDSLTRAASHLRRILESLNPGLARRQKEYTALDAWLEVEAEHEAKRAARKAAATSTPDHDENHTGELPNGSPTTEATP
jgi:hypothetical protein